MRSQKYLLIIVAGLLLAGSPAFSSEKEVLTLGDCIKIGLEKSHVLHAAQMKVDSAEARSKEAKAARLPSLSLAAGYTRLSEVPPFEIMLPFASPQFPMPRSFVISPSIFNNYVVRLSVLQPLFTGFRLKSSTELAVLNAEASLQDLEKDKIELVYTIQNAYWNLFKTSKIQKIIEENITRIESHLADIKNFYDHGLVISNEVLRVELELSNAQLSLSEADNAREMARVYLNSLLGFPLDKDIQLEPRLAEASGEAPKFPEEFSNLEDLKQRAAAKRSDLKSMEMRAKASETSMTLAKSGLFPQFYIAGNYTYARPNPRILPTQNKFRDTWDIGIAVSFDIWNWQKTNFQIDQAKAQNDQVRDALSQLKDTIELEVTQGYLSLRQASDRIAVSEKAVKQAGENYRITRDRFSQGLALNSDLIDAEASLFQAKTNQTLALVDFELAKAKLQKVVGE